MVRRAAQFGSLEDQGDRVEMEIPTPRGKKLRGEGGVVVRNVGTLEELGIKSEILCRGPTPYISR